MAGATTIRELLVELGVDAGDSAEQLEAIDKGVDTVMNTMIAGVAVVATFAAGLYALATGAANAADAVATSSAKTGVAVEQYQELAYAASQSNVESQSLDAALVKQANSMAEAASGTEAAVEAYDALGISQEELAGMSTDEAFLASADALSKMTDDQERLQAATALYGSELAAKMLPLINEGADGIAALGAEAQALGLVMSGDDVAAAAEFNDQLDSLWAVVTSVRNEIGLKLIPFLTMLTTGVKDWISANRELIDTKIEVWAGYVVDGLQMMWDAVVAVDEVVQKVFGGWEPILGAAAAIVGVVGAALLALKVSAAWTAISGAISALGVLFGATFGEVILIVGGVVAAVVALGLVVQDLWVYMNGGDSVIGRLLTQFPALQAFVDGAKNAFSGIAAVAVQLWGIIQTLGSIWFEVFSVTTLPVIMALGGAVLWLAETVFGGLGWWLTNVVTPALNVVAEGLAWLSEKANTVLGVLSAVTGGAITAPSSAGVAGTSSFGPGASEVVGGAGGTSTSSSNTLNQAGNVYNITGVTTEEIMAKIEEAESSKNAQAAAVLEGATV